MLNQVVLIGRIIDDIKLIEAENGDKKSKITIEVPRSFKNQDGVYEVDSIPITLYGNIAKNTKEYCKKGDLIGVKGRVQGKNNIEIIAEKVTFLSSSKKDEK